MRMRDGWESEACTWAQIVRTPGQDDWHDETNLPALLDLLPAPGHRIAGVDASPTMVRLAVSHDTVVPAVLADAAALPFGDETFDLVVAYMSLHDIDCMPEAVAEAGRVLERGGRLVLAIPHPVNSAGSFQGRDADAPFVIDGSYLDPAPADWVSTVGDVQLTFHSEHRPIQSYTRAPEAAGLLVEAIKEVGATARDVADHPRRRRQQRIPVFLHVRALKP